MAPQDSMKRSLRGERRPVSGDAEGPAWPAVLRVTPAEMTSLVAAAGRAPSLHNSQPWRFRVRGDVVELHADPGRALRQVDPEGRELVISCGAALFGLRLGLRRLGYVPRVELRPDPGQPGLLARV
ncbi:MAG: hypothetical protein M3Y33_09580, partial [Actinomycetota bacterium]|nr:hypothetical protein [Actinomycetota bacterium]